MIEKKIVPYEVKITGSKKAKLCMRREADAQLFNALDGQQQEAMISIARAYNIQCSGLGMKAFDPTHIRSSSNDSDHGGVLIAKYNEWRGKLKLKKLNGDMVMHVIAFGNSMNKTAEDYGTTRYRVKKELVNSLSLY